MPGKMNDPRTYDIPRDAPVSGVNMDRVLRRPRRGRRLLLCLAVIGVCLIGLFVWQAVPRGLAVTTADIQIASVTSGEFRDEILVRANAVPFAMVMLDATEGGRVEAVYAHDGVLVKRGQLLFQLSNPQRQQELLARASDVAQQVANVSNLRAALATGRSEQRRRIADVQFQLDRTRKTHARNVRLAQQGFLSTAAVEESLDATIQQDRLLAEAVADAAAENATRQHAIDEMERAVADLKKGLALVRAAANALALHAPSDGRLTDFHLEIGQSIKPGERLGRIDTPGRFKLQAQIDEFYVMRVAPGLNGKVEIGGREFPVVVTRVNPQVKERRFDIELNFSEVAQIDLQPGQTIETRITLGKPSTALLLPDGSFYTDTGGAWVFVVSPEGKSAQRRSVKLGRRAAGQIEILGGLARGERVLVSSYARFGDAHRLRLTE
jgi:HlyD family secretion protein